MLISFFMLGCVREPLPVVPGVYPIGPGPEAGMRGFSWVDEQKLAAMPRPRLDDLYWMGAEGVDVLVTLTESELDPLWFEDSGLESVHIPVEDFHAPTPDQIEEFTALVASETNRGRGVGVHCLAGLGRSGTMSAAWYIHQGMTARDALSLIRDARPGSVETDEQERALYDYAARLGNVDPRD